MTIQGLRGTGQFDEQVRPKNYRETYTFLEPNGDAPLNALLAMTDGESTNDPVYRNFRDAMPERTFKVNNGAGYNSSATSIVCDVVDQIAYVVKGSVIVNANTGEVMHATADADTATGTLTVVRNVGGTAFTIADNDDLFVAGYAAKEGDTPPTPVSFDPTISENQCQIFRTSYYITNTQDKTYLRTGSKKSEMQEKALKLHMSDIERAMFFGRKHTINGSSAQPTRFTGGLLSSISTVIDAAATSNTITEEQFDQHLMTTIFAYGSTTKVAFVGANVANHLQQFGKDRWQPTTLGGTYGVNLTGYQTHAGTLAVHLHPQFRQIPNMANTMVILDFPNIKYRYLDGRDTHHLDNRQSNGTDAEMCEFLTECGLELTQDKVHAVIKNWSLRA